MTYISLYPYSSVSTTPALSVCHMSYEKTCISIYLSERWHFDWQFTTACKRVRAGDRGEERGGERERAEGVGWLTGKISCGLSELSHCRSQMAAFRHRHRHTDIQTLRVPPQPEYWSYTQIHTSHNLHTDTHHIHKHTLALWQKKSARLLNWQNDASFTL